MTRSDSHSHNVLAGAMLMASVVADGLDKTYIE